jgi:hypothetical protein
MDRLPRFNYNREGFRKKNFWGGKGRGMILDFRLHMIADFLGFQEETVAKLCSSIFEYEFDQPSLQIKFFWACI